MIPIVVFGMLLVIVSGGNVCYQERCLQSNVSCHQQIPGSPIFSCLVSDDCKKLHSSLFKEKQNANPSENLFVEPIMFVQSFCGRYAAKSGLNITVKIKENSPYTGIKFNITQETNGEYSLCRIMDFHSVEFKEMATVWYDCPFFYTNDTDNRYKLEVTALPSNATEEYTFKIPTGRGVDPATITEWQSTIFLQTREIPNHKLTAIFQHAPSRFKVENYKVLLIINDTEIVKEEKTIKINNHTTLSKVVFNNIESGNNYVVAVKPLTGSCLNCTNKKCCTSLSHVVYLDNSDKGGYLRYLGAGAVFLLLIIIIIMLIKSRSSRKPSEAVNVLVLYSWDCNKHFGVVKAFCDHLSKNCFCRVTVDYMNLFGENSVNWLAKNIEHSDKIVVLWSKGAEAKVKNCKLSEDPGHLASKFFCYALKQLNDHLAKEVALPFTNNSVCNVFFSYFPKQKVTETLNLLPKFQINKDLNKLLCFLNNETRQFHCNFLPPEMPGAKLQQFSEGKKLLQAIEEMQKFDQENSKWFENICNSRTKPSIENVVDEEFPSEDDDLINASRSTTEEDLSIQSHQPSLPTNESGFHSMPSTSAEMPSDEFNTYLPNVSGGLQANKSADDQVSESCHPSTLAQSQTNEDASNIYYPVTSEYFSTTPSLPPSMMPPFGCYPPNMPPFLRLPQSSNAGMPTRMAFPCGMPLPPPHLPNMSLPPGLVPLPIFSGPVHPPFIPVSAMQFPMPTTLASNPPQQFYQSPPFASAEIAQSSQDDKTDIYQCKD